MTCVLNKYKSKKTNILSAVAGTWGRVLNSIMTGTISHTMRIILLLCVLISCSESNATPLEMFELHILHVNQTFCWQFERCTYKHLSTPWVDSFQVTSQWNNVKSIRNSRRDRVERVLFSYLKATTAAAAVETATLLINRSFRVEIGFCAVFENLNSFTLFETATFSD